MSLNNSQLQKLFGKTGITINSNSVSGYLVDNQTPMAIIYPKTIQELSTTLKIASEGIEKIWKMKRKNYTETRQDSGSILV